MPLYMDIHRIDGATPEAVADAHCKDIALQQRYGVNYSKYWLNEQRGKIFCLCTAPSAEIAEKVHREAHGMVAERIIEVDPEVADNFMGDGPVSATGAVRLPSQALDPGVRTIVFTDIVGSTALTQRLGDRAAMDVLDLHDRIVRAAISRSGGREVKHLGDGIMAAFASAQLAMRCAEMVHHELASAAAIAGEQVRVRIGAATGEPVERQGDFFGSTVQLAARLCAHAQPAQTLVSTEVVTMCASMRFDDVGEVMLKGFAQPTRAHAFVR
jgi:class 3 adenylate cyclase